MPQIDLGIVLWRLVFSSDHLESTVDLKIRVNWFICLFLLRYNIIMLLSLHDLIFKPVGGLISDENHFVT